VLRRCHADREGKADFVTHAPADRGRDVCRCSEEVDGTGDVEEGLVDRDPLDPGSEIVEDGDDVVAKLLVPPEVTADEDEVSAELAGPPPRHPAADAETPGFVGGREHDAPSDRDGPVPERRLQQLFDGRVEGIEVGVQDRRPPGRRRFHPPKPSRTYVRLPGVPNLLVRRIWAYPARQHGS